MATPVEEMGDRYGSRGFRVWAFTTSHRQLLLRSLKSESNPTRVDVLFKPVDRMNIPTSMNGLRVELVAPGHYFLTGTGWEGEVFAGMGQFAEDDGDFLLPSGVYMGGVSG